MTYVCLCERIYTIWSLFVSDVCLCVMCLLIYMSGVSVTLVKDVMRLLINMSGVSAKHVNMSCVYLYTCPACQSRMYKHVRCLLLYMSGVSATRVNMSCVYL